MIRVNWKPIAAIVAAASISACTAASVADPVVSNYNGATVSIQVPFAAGYLPEAEQQVYGQKAKQQALRVCAADGHKAVEYLSIRQVSDYTAEALFLCR